MRPRPEASSPAALESLRHYFSAWPEVDVVQVDADWVMRFNAMLEVLRRLRASRANAAPLFLFTTFNDIAARTPLTVDWLDATRGGVGLI